MATQNPYSRGYASIMAALQAWPALTAKVRVGNFARGNLQTPGYQEPLNVNGGDRVELRLLEKRLGGAPYACNSKAVLIRCSYPLEIKSGSQGIDLLNLVAFEVFRALTKAGPNLNQATIFKWEIPSDGDARPLDPKAKRPDWTAVLTIILTFKIPNGTFLTDTYS